MIHVSMAEAKRATAKDGVYWLLRAEGLVDEAEAIDTARSREAIEREARSARYACFSLAAERVGSGDVDDAVALNVIGLACLWTARAHAPGTDEHSAACADAAIRFVDMCETLP